MEAYNQIPYEWFEYRNHFGRYYTYWGDIYSGTLWECPNYKDVFFIVPNHNLVEITNLKPEEKTPERYRSLGHEILDFRIIVCKYRVELNQQEFNSNHGPTISKSGEVFKDMFVFGAGASAFCCFGDHKELYENDQWRSPLGYDIFNERYEDLCQHYTGVKIAIPEFELKNNTIEFCLEEDWKKYSKAFLPEITARHLNIQFYLQELFRRISKEVVSRYNRKNLYQILVNRLFEKHTIERNYWPVLVNFNYDTILDSFVERVTGKNYDHIDDYIDWDKRPFVHFKPHGSSNWGWKIPQHFLKLSEMPFQQKLLQQKLTPFELYYRILGSPQEMVNNYSYGYDMPLGEHRLGKHSLDKFQIQIVKEEVAYPALLLPFKEKDEFVMPYHHQTALKVVISDVERLIVIGWKGSEQLFLEHLQKANQIKEVVIVNPEFETVKANLKGHIKSECTWTHVTDFETFIKQDII